MEKTSNKEAHERWISMQADRDAGMKVEAIAKKYGVSVSLVRQKTRKKEKKTPTRISKVKKTNDLSVAQVRELQRWEKTEAEVNELVKINRRVRRQNAIARKPRDISSYGHTFRYWPQEQMVNRRWPKE